jgi:hypothetical protein
MSNTRARDTGSSDRHSMKSAPGWIRTNVLPLRRRPLYPLSYRGSPVRCYLRSPSTRLVRISSPVALRGAEVSDYGQDASVSVVV